MPLENNQYDSAILLEVLEHCEHPELVIKEALRVLKPGGKLLFSVPFVWFYHDVPHERGASHVIPFISLLIIIR